MFLDFFGLMKLSFTGTFKFDRIGTPYPSWVPVVGLRFIPALAGSLVPSAGFMLCREIGISKLFAAVAGILIIFGKIQQKTTFYI